MTAMPAVFVALHLHSLVAGRHAGPLAYPPQESTSLATTRQPSAERARSERGAHLSTWQILGDAIRDIHPQAPVHFMVIPKEHIPTAANIEERHGPLLAQMIAVGNDIAQREGIAEGGYRLVINMGRYLHIFHLHLHVLSGHRPGAGGLRTHMTAVCLPTATRKRDSSESTTDSKRHPSFPTSRAILSGPRCYLAGLTALVEKSRRGKRSIFQA